MALKKSSVLYWEAAFMTYFFYIVNYHSLLYGRCHVWSNLGHRHGCICPPLHTPEVCAGLRFGYYVFSVRCRASVVTLLYLGCSPFVPPLYIFCPPVVPLKCSCSASLVPLVPLLFFLSSSTLPLYFTWGRWEDLKMSYRGTLLSLFCSS